MHKNFVYIIKENKSTIHVHTSIYTKDKLRNQTNKQEFKKWRKREKENPKSLQVTPKPNYFDPS